MARASAVKERLEKIDMKLIRSYRRIFNLPSAQPGTGGRKIRDLIVDEGNRFRPSNENGIYFSHRRLQSPEGIEQLEQFAEMLDKGNNPVIVEGRLAKSKMQKIAYQAARGGESKRGVELARAIAALGPQAAYVLSRTGFMERLRSLGSSDVRKYANTNFLVELIETAPSGQWDDIMEELRTARMIYSTSKVKI